MGEVVDAAEIVVVNEYVGASQGHVVGGGTGDIEVVDMLVDA
ncbi:hypothetical protein [Nonomuraea zeae]|nr:hypothetical protein [Nonomuraea zeae]